MDAKETPLCPDCGEPMIFDGLQWAALDSNHERQEWTSVR